MLTPATATATPTTTSPAQSTTATPSASNSSSSASTNSQGISSDFETFLRMLTTQLENQDPLDPVKTEDFAVQLATFSGVEQQVKTNNLLESLGQQLALSGMAQFADWVEMEARSSGPVQFTGQPLSLVPQVEAAAEKSVLVVKNDFGNVVQRIPVDPKSGEIKWSGKIEDGIAPNGLYTFAVENSVAGKVSSTTPVEAYSRIVEARNDGGTTKVILAGGVEIDATNVTSLRRPAAQN